MQRIVFLGAGAHLAVVAEVAMLRGDAVIGSLDSRAAPGAEAHGVKILGDDDRIATLAGPDVAFHIAIADPGLRRRLRERVEQIGGNLCVLVHPTAIVSPSARIGVGCFVAAGAIVGTKAVLGPNTILNTGAQIDHDCEIGSDCHIAPGAVLAGGIVCGSGTFVASGAVIGPNVRIGSGCTIGAGATVLHDVADGTRVFGTPARPAGT